MVQWKLIWDGEYKFIKIKVYRKFIQPAACCIPFAVQDISLHFLRIFRMKTAIGAAFTGRLPVITATAEILHHRFVVKNTVLQCYVQKSRKIETEKK
ncbi:MAG: hypothetical protein DWQ05_16595 [Calditrichaeota bacterium]|nr:MAG: hypothetical protein DWQ05_16595 [Calditrichota bacterium]